jgi:uncharacterized protein (DUF58 family)
MTSRAGGAGVLAVCLIGGAWLVGSTALAILAFGLGLAALATRGWTWLIARGLSVERQPVAAPPVEGGPLRLAIEVSGRRWLASQIEWHDPAGPLGELVTPIGRRSIAQLVVPAVPRGRYPLGPGRLVVGDPFGLGRVEIPVAGRATLLVRPRVPELETLFTDSGAWGEGGRRAMLRRPSGLEPHGVREYVEGEPLRAVHWPTSARRGELMVRELEEAPRENVAVILDVEARAVAGERGDSSFDDAVRVAAGLLRAHAARSRRALLVIGAPQPGIHRVRSLGRDWDEALDALAGVELARDTPLRELVAPRGGLGTVAELVVVTARPEVVADALVARVAIGRRCAVVAVDSPTYVGRPPAGPSPTLLRLTAAGVALAVVRHGVPLAEALGDLRVSAVG